MGVSNTRLMRPSGNTFSRNETSKMPITPNSKKTNGFISAAQNMVIGTF